MAVGPGPSAARSAIRTRSSSDRKRGEITLVDDGSKGGTTLTLPSFRRTVVPCFQMWAIERLIPSSLHAARIDQPSANSSMKRRLANDFGAAPDPCEHDE